MAVYNLSFLDNATNPIDIFTGVGSVISSGNQYLIGYLLLVSFFIIFLVLNLRNDFAEVLVIDSFLTLLLATLLYFGGMVDAMVLVYPVLILILGMVFFFVSKK
jgi:hypothetical protein|tara:strand:+ start:1332 stop:1643 length:312 start_codon:yes stop_codon:yes gene_type:complete